MVGGTGTGTGIGNRVSGVEIDIALGTVVAWDNGGWFTGGNFVEGIIEDGGGGNVNGLACIFGREWS